MNARAGLAFDDVTHRYKRRVAVREFSLEVDGGELVCLVGPSGCGKTTVLRLAAGLESLQQGRISIAGQPIAEPGRDMPPEQRSVGLVFQDIALFPHLTVEGNVAFGLNRLSAAERRERVSAMLRQVHMDEYATAWPHQLSGGQQQRVALARALAPAPRAMLLDEPFSGLDTRLRAAVRDEALHVLKASGTTVLAVTHDPEEAMFMADRIAVMNDGRLEQVGTPSEIYTCPASEFVAEFFSEVNRIDGEVRGGQAATPFGPVPAPGMNEGARVHVLIRPEGLRLAGAAVPPHAGPAQGAVSARVLASRLLGRTSWVHVRLDTATHRHTAGPVGTEEHSHWHVRVPGRYLPPEGSEVRIGLDLQQAFVFPVRAP
jgi:iron(III) transport system ATP-binding protein